MRIDPRVVAMRPVLAHLAEHGERMCKGGAVVGHPPECEACMAPVGAACRLAAHPDAKGAIADQGGRDA